MSDASLRRAPTINDVARLSNVSRQTVSRVINNKGEVSEATRQRVLAAITELGYHPNALARSLVTDRTQVIGLVLPNIDHPYFPLIARGVEDAASDLDYSVFLCNAAGDYDRELRVLRRLRGNRVDGVIIFNSHLTDEEIEQAVGNGCPVVLVNREVPDQRGTVVWPGYEQGGYLAAKHLIDIGRQRIAYFGPADESNVDTDKLAGFRRALAEVQLEVKPNYIIRAASTQKLGFMDRIQNGTEVISRALNDGITFDGICASNDLLAIGAIRALAAQGIRVPQDVAVIGFGASNVSSIVVPQLSTISMPLHEMGVAAFQALLGRLVNQQSDPHTVQIKPTLIIRASSTL